MYILFILIPKLANAFSVSLSGKLKLIFKLWYFALTRKIIFREKPMSFIFYFAKSEFIVKIESIVDLAALDEVFVSEEYNWDLIKDPKVILDLGAHYGDTTLYYHLKYPDAHIYAVEPAPDTFSRLVDNTSSIPNITTIHAGIGKRDGFADLNVGSSSLGNSFKQRKDIKSIVSVPVYTLQTLLEKYKIGKADIIKFDIEGGEEYFFTTHMPEQFASAYIGEVHIDLISISSEIFLSRFANFEIEKVNLSNPQRFILKAVNISGN